MFEYHTRVRVRVWVWFKVRVREIRCHLFRMGLWWEEWLNDQNLKQIKLAATCEKAKEKGQRQQVKFVCLNMKENMTTGYKSKFLASLNCFSGPFGPYLVRAKKSLFLENQNQKFISSL